MIAVFDLTLLFCLVNKERTFANAHLKLDAFKRMKSINVFENSIWFLASYNLCSNHQNAICDSVTYGTVSILGESDHWCQILWNHMMIIIFFSLWASNSHFQPLSCHSFSTVDSILPCQRVNKFVLMKLGCTEIQHVSTILKIYIYHNSHSSSYLPSYSSSFSPSSLPLAFNFFSFSSDRLSLL